MQKIAQRAITEFPAVFAGLFFIYIMKGITWIAVQQVARFPRAGQKQILLPACMLDARRILAQRGGARNAGGHILLRIL